MGDPGFWWGPLLLLLLDLPSSGSGRNPAESPAQQVNGMLGGSAWFPLKLPPTKTVAEIEWFFQTGHGSKFRIADLRDGKLEWRNTSDRFGQRLEMADATTLRIGALEKEDSGVFMAEVLFATNEVREQTFRLSVFEPVPDPQIHYQLTSKTVEGCNLTLQCLASDKGPFNVTWKRGYGLRALEGESDWYWLSAGGTELHLAWRPDSSDLIVTCLLGNPVDQKNDSLDLLSICKNEGARECLSWVWVAMLAGLVVQLLAIASVNILERTMWRQD